MQNKLVVNIIRGLALVLLQVIVFKNVNIFGLISPSVFILFILLLPYRTPHWLVILLGFVIGLSVDLFFPSMGIHAAAGCAMAFSRVILLTFFDARYKDADEELNIRDQGWSWHLTYAGILTLLYHIFYFPIEHGGFHHPLKLVGTILLSTITSLLLIVVLQMMFNREGRRRRI